MRRIFPEPAGPASLEELYGRARHRRDDRPWVGICMIASLDGATVVDGRSGGLSNPNDAAVLKALRAAADLILVGASTVRAEGYGPPSKPGQRIGVVTAAAQLDPEKPIFASGTGFLVMPEDGPPALVSSAGPIDTVRAGRGRVDVALALRRLGDVTEEPTFVQAEGGAHLNGSLLDADCVDELDLTLSPRLVGGDGPRAVAGARFSTAGFSLAHLAVDDGSFLYSRWLRRDR